MSVAKSRLTRKYQITVPTSVRKHLGLKAGDYVYLVIEDNKVLLRPFPESWTDHFAGCAKDFYAKFGGGRAVIEEERNSWGDKDL